MKEQISWAWAIDSRSLEGHGLLGIGWGRLPEEGNVLVCQDGLRTMLFRRKEDALKCLRERVRPKEGYRAFPRATVKKVRISIREA